MEISLLKKVKIFALLNKNGKFLLFFSGMRFLLFWYAIYSKAQRKEISFFFWKEILL